MNLLDMLLRAKKLILISFVLLFTTLLILMAFRKDKYEARMTLLIRSETANNLVNADPSEKALQAEVETEEKVNSEIALLESTDILKAVVVDAGLEKPYLDASGSNRPAAVEQATRILSKTLKINGVRKSAIIDISYISTNRDQAKAVLDALSREYLKQYSQLHTAGGAAGFYRAESDALETELQKDQDERAKLLASSGYSVLPEAQLARFTRITELEKERADADVSLAETSSRLRQIASQQNANTERVTTQRRVIANSALVSNLSSHLSDLENKLISMESKFLDNDPLVVELKREIANTKTALENAQTVHSEDVTTDVNPLRQTLDGEANTLHQAMAGYTSKRTEIDRQLSEERGTIAGTEQSRIRVDELSRQIKVLQDSADLYRSRALAAAAAESMDPRKFSNVVEASHPTVPVLPIGTRFTVRNSFLLALMLSLGLGLASEWRRRREFELAGDRYPVYENAAAS